MQQQVIKRDGRLEDVQFDKIKNRIKHLCTGLNMAFVDIVELSKKVINGLYNGVTTVELDNLAADTAASNTTTHSDYGILAARIAISNLHKETREDFSKVITDMFVHINPKTGMRSQKVSDTVFRIATTHADLLNKTIDYRRDFLFNYFGYKTLEKSYLIKINKKPVERPQHMWMRVAIALHEDDIDSVVETYHLMSLGKFTHATPTLCNAGTVCQQLSSCYLMSLSHDSMETIMSMQAKCALISQYGGGIGFAISNVSSKGTTLVTPNGSDSETSGLIPVLRMLNNTARLTHQSTNDRPGAYAMYLEPLHADIFAFLNLKKPTAVEEERARDLFYGLWVPDLFMHRVKNEEMWTLMSPTDCPGLDNVWGDEFDKLYTQYERDGKGTQKVPAQQLWLAIVNSQLETGTPYILYKDACNEKSNHRHLGTIKCSNLCTEIVQYTSSEEIAVCNLASIALNKFVVVDDDDDGKKRFFDFEDLKKVTKVITRNLNKVIDLNYYPVTEAKTSNQRHRPIGIGVQGLADTFILMRYPFESVAAKQLNKEIFETIYFAALEASCELAQRDGVYHSYAGSPVSQGILQFDMWKNVEPSSGLHHNWEKLRKDIRIHGVRKSFGGSRVTRKRKSREIRKRRQAARNARPSPRSTRKGPTK